MMTRVVSDMVTMMKNSDDWELRDLGMNRSGMMACTFDGDMGLGGLSYKPVVRCCMIDQCGAMAITLSPSLQQE